MATALVLAAIVGGALLWREKGRTEAALLREREALRFTFAASDQIASRAMRRIASAGPSAAGEDEDFCRKALAYYEEIARRYRDDAEMRAIAAAAFHRVGYLRDLLGLPGAEDAYRRAIPLYEAEAAVAPRDPEPRRELAMAFDDLGSSSCRVGGLRAAEPWCRRALEVRRSLAVDFPVTPDFLISLAITEAHFAALLDDLGRCPEAETFRTASLDHSEAAQALRPGDARLANNLAWPLACRPGASPASRRRTVELARKAVALAPRTRAFWNTLGVALYRAEDWGAAAEALETSMRLHDGGDAYDWLFLAMARAHLGEEGPARRLYERSLAWIDANAREDDELRRFRAEAADLLRLANLR
jgi:tetratricopeptide (TPR) repeat protein